MINTTVSDLEVSKVTIQVKNTKQDQFPICPQQLHNSTHVLAEFHLRVQDTIQSFPYPHIPCPQYNIQNPIHVHGTRSFIQSNGTPCIEPPKVFYACT